MKYLIKYIKFADIITIFILSIIAGVLLLIFSEKKTESKKLTLKIEDNTYIIPWKNGVIDLKTYGKNMTLEINESQAKISNSDCPDKLCIHQSWISECGQMAVCMPNKTALIIECNNNSYDIPAIF